MDKNKQFCNLHFPCGTVVQVHIWNNLDLNKGLRWN